MAGTTRGTELATEAYPDVADTAAQVVEAQAPGLAAEEVEQQVTIPLLERELNGTPRHHHDALAQHLRALADHALVFRDGIDDYWGAPAHHRAHPGRDPAAQPHARARSGVVADRPDSLLTCSRSDTKNLRQLSELQRWTVIPTLKQVPGVADVSNFGGLTTQYELELDPQQLMRFNISLNTITGRDQRQQSPMRAAACSTAASSAT